MLEDFREKERSKTSRLRSIMDYSMGVLLVLVGLCFLFYEQLNLPKLLGKEHSSLDYVIAVLFIAYGAWRIHRGYKKDYFQ
jgi:uncharacterized membrane protein HdeD (DUF308 family)